MCAYGSAHRKCTAFHGSAPWLHLLHRKCSHRSHEQIEGRDASRASGRYPSRLVRLIVRTARRNWRLDWVGQGWGRQGRAQKPDEPKLDQEAPIGPVGCHGLLGPREWGRWKVGVAHIWSTSDHINVLEAYAETLALGWVLRQGSPLTPRRVISLQDSQVLVGAGGKGRSSSFGLQRPLRRTAALLLAGNLTLSRLWIPSKGNPADGPSRGRPIGVF